MILKLTAKDAAIIEHRLSAGTLGDVAADTYMPEDVERNSETYLAAAQSIDEVSDRLLLQVGAGRDITVDNPVEAWCIADCIEGSTWVALTEGEFGRDSRKARNADRQVEALRARLNDSPEFVRLLGRKVRPIAAVVEEAPATAEALIAAMMAGAR